MIELCNVDKIYIFGGVTDFRLGMKGLTRIVYANFEDINEIKRNTNIFVFCSKNKKGMKVLQFEQYGIALYHKNLYKDKFIFPDFQKVTEVTKQQLKTILTGLDFVKKIDDEQRPKKQEKKIY